MNSYTQFYMERLYPLQDGVLKIVRDLKLPFYLTGGTTLSRFYLHHRFSDDLDLFVNNDGGFESYVKNLVTFLSAQEATSPFKLNNNKLKTYENFAQVFLSDGDVELKIDLVNDVPSHYGDIADDAAMGKIDSWRNILSNKISALFRFAEKDYVDVWGLSKKFQFDWKEIFNEARQKEASVDAEEISNLFATFPFERLDVIKWLEGFDYSTIRDDFKIISEDIFYGNKNSLR